ncbi:metallophosphoesterase [Parafrankia sp. EUN1f]|uniref:metallophosphoesterase n=1 Tax=Parafrankia sp. EUN1f TaxID=102897 RepID=UPI0001C44A50|nr:metallophosphoesterase [Parafrankia sp. EUN1f]EFC84806.1 hypothetical protein FrEUN1fDRAFT_2123 [Parafrankia sp. EUN1f]
MVRIAAVGDLHIRPGAAARLRPVYQRAAEVADILLLAGDLTQDGGYARGEETAFDLQVALTHYAPTRTTLVGERLELYPFLGSHLLGAAIDGEPVTWPEKENRTKRFQATGMPNDERDGDPARNPASGERQPVRLALHGHAHYGTEAGVTPAGTAVRNVVAPVIGAPFAVYRLPEASRIG